MSNETRNERLAGRWREALESIAANTCCGKCQEAALVAKAALAATQPQGAIGAATEQEEQAKQAAIRAAQLLAYTAEHWVDIEAAKELIRKVSE